MLNAGLPVRHIEEGKNVPMYETNINCISSAEIVGAIAQIRRSHRSYQYGTANRGNFVART
jgi:uncharacterized protein YcsI (UPF0317 family)